MSPARSRPAAPAALAACLALCAALACGCAAPDAVARSQRMQLAAMTQYRDQMAAYHEQVKARLTADKRRELDAALESSLALDADADGRLPVAEALQKMQKRIALEDEFRAALARLDGEFAERQRTIGRAIVLARSTLGLLQDYTRLGVLVRSLFVRELESRQLAAEEPTQ